MSTSVVKHSEYLLKRFETGPKVFAREVTPPAIILVSTEFFDRELDDLVEAFVLQVLGKTKKGLKCAVLYEDTYHEGYFVKENIPVVVL